jgi:hypothetical protein
MLMGKMLFFVFALFQICLFTVPQISNASYSIIPLDYPDVTNTHINGIDGNNIVGDYNYGAYSHGFIYNGVTWTSLDYPGSYETHASAIDNDKIVGFYYDFQGGGRHSFIYDGTEWTSLDFPGAQETYAMSIDGDNIVGYYYGSPLYDHGFLYNGTTWTTLNFPGAFLTYARGIDGNKIVGHYQDFSGKNHGFIFDGTTWTSLDYPGAFITYVSGIDNGNIVGTYQDDSGVYGFIYDGTTWASLKYSDYVLTYATDIDGGNIVGNYLVSYSSYHGFLAIAQYVLTIYKSGIGTITSSPLGIVCGPECSEEYSNNTIVTLTATPDAGFLFTGWSGDCSYCGADIDCSITMNADKTCVATFDVPPPPNYYVLWVTKTGTGSGTVASTPAGISCGVDCIETYPKVVRAKNVKLKIKPDAYSTFLGWGGDCQGRGTKTTCTVKMDFDKNVTASFGLPDISVSPNSHDFGNIVVKKSSSPATFTIQNSGTGNLKTTTIKIIGTDAKMFKIKGGGKKTIAPGGTYSFTATFRPTSAGTKSAMLQVLSNDLDTPTIDIPLSGTGN